MGKPVKGKPLIGNSSKDVWQLKEKHIKGKARGWENQKNIMCVFADPGVARGCSTNTVVIKGILRQKNNNASKVQEYPSEYYKNVLRSM